MSDEEGAVGGGEFEDSVMEHATEDATNINSVSTEVHFKNKPVTEQFVREEDVQIPDRSRGAVLKERQGKSADSRRSTLDERSKGSRGRSSSPFNEEEQLKRLIEFRRSVYGQSEDSGVRKLSYQDTGGGRGQTGPVTSTEPVWTGLVGAIGDRAGHVDRAGRADRAGCSATSP